MKKPMIMGGLMGLMMLWMIHGMMTGDGLSWVAAAVFIAAHVVVLAIVVGAAIFAARLSPRARKVIDRLHRPSLRHVAAMMGSAALVMAVVHVTAHGFGGV